MSVQSVNTLVSSILSYVGDNKQANNNIQQQVAALLGGALVTTVIEMGKGAQLDTVCKELDTVKPEIVAVLSGIVDKAPAVTIRNTAVSDFVKRINRAFASEATKQADAKAQTMPSGEVRYVSLTGTPFLRSSLDPGLNNPSSTKQNLNSTTGLVVIASDGGTRYYLHNYFDLTTPAATSTPTNTSLQRRHRQV